MLILFQPSHWRRKLRPPSKPQKLKVKQAAYRAARVALAYRTAWEAKARSAKAKDCDTL